MTEAAQDIFDQLEAAYGSKSGIARALGITRQALHHWWRKGRVPARHCAALVEGTDEHLTLQDLRPDVFPCWVAGRPPRRQS